MKRLDSVQGNVSMTLEKLVAIRGDLVRTDDEWESWDFVKLTEALRHWVKRNPPVSNDKEREENTRDRRKLFNARGEEVKLRGCVYCGDTGHKATQCEKVIDTSERKKILARRGLCFNCATRTHGATECSSKTSCQHCNKRHHYSIWHTSKPGPDSDSDPDSDSKKIRTREKPGPRLEKNPDSCLTKPGLDF